MNKIEKVFAENKKVLIPSITAGDPDLEATKELILAMEEAGAGVIELGEKAYFVVCRKHCF